MADDPSTPPPADNDGLLKALKGLVERHGDPTAALRVVLDENYRYRDQIRDLKGKVPGEADVVLKGDDAKRWQSYRELGEPGDLKRSLKDAETNAAEVTRFRRAERHAEVASVAGFNPKVFRRLAEQDGLEFEIKPEKKGSEEIPVVHVKGKDDKGEPTLVPLTRYAETHWVDFLPSLQGGEKREPARPQGTPPRRDSNVPPPRPGNREEDIQQAIRTSGYAGF